MPLPSNSRFAMFQSIWPRYTDLSAVQEASVRKCGRQRRNHLGETTMPSIRLNPVVQNEVKQGAEKAHAP